MAQGQSGKHGSGAFVFGSTASSSLAALARFRWGIVWAAGLGLGAFGDTLLLLDVSAAERVSAQLDRCAVAWAVTLLGYVSIIASTQVSLWERSRVASRALQLLALLALSYHSLLLRWPSLVGTAIPGSRLEHYTLALSRSWGSLPVQAFGELLAVAVLFTHAALFLASESRSRGSVPPSDPSSPHARTLFLAAVLLYGLKAWVIVGLATGA